MKNLYFIIALLVFSYSALAQKSFRLESITVDDGLSQSKVNTIVQDNLGFLWIGTMDGLNRYDGQSIKIYKHKKDDPSSLAQNDISKLFVDKNNNLWIGSKGVLSRYNPQKDGFEHFPISIGPNYDYSKFKIENIFESRDGTFVLSYLNAMYSDLIGLINFNPESYDFFIREDLKKSIGAFYYFESDKNGDWMFFADSIFRITDKPEKWSKIENNTGRIINVKYDQKTDRIFIVYEGSDDLKLAELIPQSNKVVNIMNDANFFSKTLVRSNGEIWFGDHTINILYPKDSTIKTVDSKNIIVSEFYETPDGVIWIGTSGFGLKKYNPLTNRFSYLGKIPDDPLSLSNNYIGPIYTKDDNILYVATFDGVDMVNLKENSVNTLKFNGIDKRDKVLSFYEYNNGEIAINFAGSGSFDVKSMKKLRYLNIPFNQIHELNKNDYMAVNANRAVRLKQHKKDTIYNASPESLLGAVSFIQNDTLWITTLYEGIMLLDINTGKVLKRFIYDPENPETAPNGELVKCMYQDSKKNIWIGTLGLGLCLYNPGAQNFRYFSEKDGLPNNVIYGILEDDAQNLWLSTNNGICRFNINTYKSTNFDASDGLQSNEFNTGSFFKSASGTMYFGGVNGLTYFNPKDIDLKELTLKSILSGVYFNNKRINNYQDFLEKKAEQQVLKIPNEGRDFGFDFVGVSFSMPGRISYRYILENYDNEWHDNGRNSHVNFTNIPPGEYMFRVKAVDSHGNLEQEGASMIIVVDMPFWKKPVVWTYSFAIISILGMLVFRARTNNLQKRTNQLAKIVEERTSEIKRQNIEIASQNEELMMQSAALETKNKELEKAKDLLELEVKYFHQRKLLIAIVETQEEERKRISKDLHDELGAVLSITRMFLIQARDSNKSIKEIKENLREACELTENAMSTMRRISHELMPPQLEKFGLIKTILSVVRQINETKGMEVDFYFLEVNTRWTISIELGLYRICMEMINNTLKHAQSKKISIQLIHSNELITFYYSDDGIGLPKSFNQGLGFINIETRTNIMGGTFEILKTKNKGFSACVKVPYKSLEI